MYYRKFLIPPVFIILSIFFSSCCNCGKTAAGEKMVKGFITVVGNEPFAHLAVRTDDNNIFLLECSEEIYNELIKKQGAYYYINYSKLYTREPDTVIVVEKAIPFKKEKK